MKVRRAANLGHALTAPIRKRCQSHRHALASTASRSKLTNAERVVGEFVHEADRLKEVDSAVTTIRQVTPQEMIAAVVLPLLAGLDSEVHTKVGRARSMLGHIWVGFGNGHCSRECSRLPGAVWAVGRRLDLTVAPEKAARHVGVCVRSLQRARAAGLDTASPFTRQGPTRDRSAANSVR
jgi:hypothetical protein